MLGIMISRPCGGGLAVLQDRSRLRRFPIPKMIEPQGFGAPYGMREAYQKEGEQYLNARSRTRLRSSIIL